MGIILYWLLSIHACPYLKSSFQETALLEKFYSEAVITINGEEDQKLF